MAVEAEVVEADAVFGAFLYLLVLLEEGAHEGGEFVEEAGAVSKGSFYGLSAVGALGFEG